MNKVQRSLALIKASNQVIRSHPSLLAYPIISAVVLLFVFLLITLPIIGGTAYLLDQFGQLPTTGGPESEPWQLAVVTPIAFIAVSFVSILFSATMFIGAEAALNGEKLSFRQSLSTAWKKRKNIFKWTLFSATVGYLMRLAYEKLAWLGYFAHIGAVMFGLAWTLAVVFIVPTLVKHDVGPIEALKRSAALLKRAWGEKITADISIGLFAFVILLFIFVSPAVVLGLMAIDGTIAVAAAVSIGAVLLLISLMFLFYIASISSIFTAALYRYAETGDYVGPYTPGMIEGAFRPIGKK